VQLTLLDSRYPELVEKALLLQAPEVEDEGKMVSATCC
jgi:hypothetical protein